LLAATPAAAFDVQGHRGARGLAPENTLAGFRTALAAGDYHRVGFDTSVASGNIEMGVLCRQSLVAHLDAEEIIQIITI
jgi:hypothetical protein